MRIRVLGPMIVSGRDDLPLRDRAVLGALTVRAGSSVSMDELADAIWRDRRPPSYRKVVQGCVMRLRRELGDEAIHTREGAYALAIAGEEIDAVRFQELVEAAETAVQEGEPRRAEAAADEAVRLWRGRPYPELPEWPPAEAEALRCSELRETAEDVLIESTLLSGRSAAAAARGEALLAAAPYREARWALVARAQYAAGRQADALATLRTLRTVLAEELGIDPSPEVAALESALLRQDRSLDVPSAVGSGRWIFSRTGRAVAAILVVAILVVVGLAAYQHQLADRASREAAAARDAAGAIRVGELASAQRNPSIALALAAQALSMHDSRAVRSRVLDTLGNFSGLLTTGVRPAGAWPKDTGRAVSPDGRSTAVAHPASIQLARDGRPTHRLITPADDPTALVFSPDGRYLAAGMSQRGFAPTGSTIVWDVSTGAEVAAFDSGDGAVHGHVFAPDDSSIWSLGDDGVHQWDLTASHALVRAADGEAMVFRAGDVVLALGDRSTTPWVEYACAIAGRPLTAAEWREYLGDRPYTPTCR